MPSLYPSASDTNLGVNDTQKSNVDPSQIGDASQTHTLDAENRVLNANNDIEAISRNETTEVDSKEEENFENSDDFGDFTGALQGSTQIGTNGPRNVPDEETIDLVETTNSNNNDDENEFGEFNGGSSVPAEDTSAINASLIDSFVPEKVTSTKNETDIFSNLADFAMTGEPLPSDNFGTSAPNSLIAESPGLPQHRLSVGLAETDLSFLPSMDSRGRFEGKLSDLVNELIRQQRFLEASECGNYIEKLGERKRICR